MLTSPKQQYREYLKENENNDMMIFLDIGPWRASEIVPPRREIVTVDFCFKHHSESKKDGFRPPQNIKWIKHKREKLEKSYTWKPSKSIGSMTVRNAQIHVSQK